MHSARALLPAIAMSLGILAMRLAARQHEAPLAAPLESLALDVAGHVGRDRAISDEEQRVAGMDQYLFRTYARDSATAFTVYVGYYPRQMQGSTIHSPKNCLPGAGWHALAASTASIDAPGGVVPVNRYELRNGQARALVYYWYQGRGRVAANEYLVKWNLLRDAVLLGRTEEALVRVVVPVVEHAGEDPVMAVARADDTARIVAQALIPRLQDLLPSSSRPVALAADAIR